MPFSINFEQLAVITNGKWHGKIEPSIQFTSLSTDSRNFSTSQGKIFFAILGKHFDGHDYIQELATNGQQYFVVSKQISLPENCAQLIVNDTLEALQCLASYHRQNFKGKVIAITGSNGKTIVKEWLFDLVSPFFTTYKSPKSFNSQIGVALSILQADINNQVFIFEAGISSVDEMQKLQKMLLPHWGVLTHIGVAHDEGFASVSEKVSEKMNLFKTTSDMFCHEDVQLFNEISRINVGALHTIGISNKATYSYRIQNKNIQFQTPLNYTFGISFNDTVALRNMSLAISIGLALGISPSQLSKITPKITPIAMRLELIKGIQQSIIINDSWTNDPEALNHALDFLIQQKKNKEATIILSDFPPYTSKTFYEIAANYLNNKGIQTIITIGEDWKTNLKLLQQNKCYNYPTTNLFISNIDKHNFSNQAILIKGSRHFKLEEIVSFLQEKNHQTILEINLANLTFNFQLLKKRVSPTTKIMAMVKAFAYGSGNDEVAQHLVFNQVDYLAVAFIDEGLTLRKAGIKTPILVLNPEFNFSAQLKHFNLEPAIGSLLQLKKLIDLQIQLAIHIEIDTGMHRMGFLENEIETICELLNKNKQLTIKGIFTHLASSEDSSKDSFTQDQLKEFHLIYETICEKISYRPIKHSNNSSASIRFGSEGDNDMVRLGIALYGIDPSKTISDELLPVFEFKTHISQIKTVKAGDGIGYGSFSVSTSDRKIAILAVGYADGFNRSFSQGNHYVMINNKKAYTVGNICMDMCMVDISHIDCEEGDEVELFGKQIPISLWSKTLNTIPYEILTSISQRVKRIFIAEN